MKNLLLDWMVIPKKITLISFIVFVFCTQALSQAPEGTWLGDREGVEFFPSGEIRAYWKKSKTVHPKLTEHSRKMVPGVYQVGENAFTAWGYALTTTAMIVGDDGVIIIDPPEGVDVAREMWTELQKFTDKPVKAVVYSHWHLDHFAGVLGFIDREQAESGEVKIFAHKTFLELVNKSGSGGTGPIISARLDYTSGSLLKHGETGAVNEGLGPHFLTSSPSLVAPNTLVDDVLEVTIAGVKMHLQNVPSETTDEVVVWFPDLEILHAAEAIQGENFPNLHSIRGTRYRDPEMWYTGVNTMRQFPAKYMISSHARPVSGYEAVAKTLTNYRDAIQFVYDQTIRYMNLGMLPDELVDKISLPEHLANDPFLGETYGTVSHAVRQIYIGELGWFYGDPTFLDPIRSVEASKRYIEMMGGQAKVFAAAKIAAESGDHQWSAELTTHLIRTNKEDWDSRRLKAENLRQLGYANINPNWRNWYLTSATELLDTMDFSGKADMSAPDFILAFPTSEILRGLRFRLAAERALDVQMIFGMTLPDTKESYALEIRRGIVQFHDSVPENADVVIEIDRALLNSLMVGDFGTGPDGIHYDTAKSALVAKFESGDVKLQKGTAEELKRFFSYFDPLSRDVLPIALK